jgi:hypothetical protein
MESSNPLRIGDADRDPLPSRPREITEEEGGSIVSMNHPFFHPLPSRPMDPCTICRVGPCVCLDPIASSSRAGNPPQGARYDPIYGGPNTDGELFDTNRPK